MKKEVVAHDNLNVAVLEKLKSAGHRVTKSRLQVLSVLEATKKALSPADIFQLTSKKGEAELDRVTVYRILEAFEELEIVHPVGNGRYIYCAHQTCGHERHFIAICTKCGETSEVGASTEFSDSLTTLLKKKIDFKMTSEFFVVRGLCKKCQ
ncbi:MAG: transcriptional repressor [Bdellovibrionaceae bacterium]|nr:transcriptional repressor [Pseudobdellovibrionaceae bacterium]